MAKKKPTRKKTARTPRGKSKTKRSASAEPKSRAAKASKSVSKKKTKKAPAARTARKKKKAGTPARKKTSSKRVTKKKPASRSAVKKKVTTKKAAAKKPKTTAKDPAPASSSGKKTTGRQGKPAQGGSSATAAVVKKAKHASGIRPGGAPPDRKAGMLDPTPPHPNDAANARSTPARLTRKQLNHFRDLLLKRRAELIRDVQAMESGALRGGGGSDANHAPMHMADAGSDTFDQEFALQLAATERELLQEINESLQLIRDGTFGMCEVTGKPISLPRLEAKPWAKVCIEVARERDRFHRARH